LYYFRNGSGKQTLFTIYSLKVITPSEEKYLDELARPYFQIASHKIWTNSFVCVYNLRRIVTLFNAEQRLRF
jgi:hypothetical protein